MLVAVRAIAPVAGMPPNNGATMLAAPCAISSVLEWCRDPIIPSATTAESSDSMAASSAMVSAAGERTRSSSNVTGGSDGLGREALMAPKRE